MALKAKMRNTPGGDAPREDEPGWDPKRQGNRSTRRRPPRRSRLGDAIRKGAQDGTLYLPPSKRGLEKPSRPVQRKPGVRKHPVFRGKRNPYRNA